MARRTMTAGDGEGFGGRRMTRIGFKGMVAAVALLALAVPGEGSAMPSTSPGVSLGIANMVVAQAAGGDQTAPAGAAPAAAADAGGLSDATKQGVGCLVTSGASLAYATFAAGATESLMLVAGGLLAPSASPTLWLGLTSTLVAATCAMGAAATPAVLWAVEQRDNIGANLTAQAQSLGNDILQASNALVSGVFAARPAVGGARMLAERPDAAR